MDKIAKFIVKDEIMKSNISAEKQTKISTIPHGSYVLKVL